MATPADKADLIIRHARIVDGSGGAAQVGDVAIVDDRIVAVGGLTAVTGASEVDGTGKVLAPGFIDVHTHDDRAVLVDRAMACKVSQGVTTVVTGNCGVSLAPLSIDRRPPAPLDILCDQPDGYFADFASYLAALEAEPAALNVAAQVGHSTLRIGAMDRLDRAATAKEIKLMRGRLETSLAAGAIGFSTGLFYPPAEAAPTEEVIEIAKALNGYSAMHSTHMRDEGDHIVQALEESFRIGREAGVPVVVSHHKCAGQPNHGRSRETLAIIEAARQRQPLGLDAYPYVAGSTMLASNRLMEASRIIVAWSKSRPDVAGRDLDEIAAEMGLDRAATADALAPAGGIFFLMDEEDVRRILAYPWTMIGSDGLPHDSHPHPRLWGTFPRVLGHYVREVGLFTLEEAVRKMTALPARQFGLKDRGAIRVGAYADLVLFDPRTIRDTATFERPTQPAAGIDLVMVNGRAVWRAGAPSGARPGRALRRQDLDPPQAAA